jgi:hypothetical protein
VTASPRAAGKTKRDDANALTAAQLAWCRTMIRSFAPAEASVQRRHADVAANRAYFGAHAAAPLAPWGDAT